MDQIILTLQTYALKVVLALVAVVIGLMVIGWIKKLTVKALDKSKLDSTLKPFIASLVSAALKVFLVMSILEIFGLKATSFAAVIAASGFAIGMAFSGALSNFAGGVFILTLRPFKVGDYIEANGHEGFVEAINVLNTHIITVDNKEIIVPNGGLSTAPITNFTSKPTRRVDLVFGVGYEQDLDKVQETLMSILNAHALVLQDPEPFARVSGHGDSAVNFTVRAWTLTENYWAVYFDLLETVKKRFDQENISIPFPQMDVHMDK